MNILQGKKIKAATRIFFDSIALIILAIYNVKNVLLYPNLFRVS